MKKYAYLLGILWLCGSLIACGSGGNVDANAVDSTATSIATPETNTPEVSAEDNKQAVMEATKLARQLRDAFAKMKDKEARYVEEVPITSFLGTTVEVATFEITKVDANLTRVHVDYFDSAPMGGKRYFINNGELFAVEIVRLTEEESENGSLIDEKVSHICYYKDGKLIQIWDNKEQKELAPSSVAWANENLEHWTEIKKNL